MLLYLHGFRSSPQSLKARQIALRLRQLGQEHLWLCPQLPVAPAEVCQLLDDIGARYGSELSVIGSSLGGFYATWLAERTGCRAVLLNPAVHPERDLLSYIGSQPAWHSGEMLDIRPEFITQLAAMQTSGITLADRYLLVAARGDEVLDWREMVARYPNAHQWVIEGSDHGLSVFPSFLEDILRFCGLPHGRTQ